MRSTVWFLVGALGLATGATAQPVDGSGLSLPQFQGRIRLGMSVTAGPLDAAVGAESSRLSAASVFGDYYFARSAPQAGEASGFRATSGVFLGSRLGSWGGPELSAPGGSAFAIETHRFSLLSASALQSPDVADSGAVPYVGLGYSGSSAKGGWGFSADLGLMALNPGSVVRFGRNLGAGQSLDETLRDMRLSPMLQLGVSYSF
ncbi:MAG: hypothetical protein ABI633_02715 [Burkholderiales bacterium]